MTENDPSAPPPPPPPPPPPVMPKRKTHANERVVDLLKLMSLLDRLRKNKEIEAKNSDMALWRFDALIDRGKVDEDDKDDASFITITKEDKQDILAPGMWQRLRDILTTNLYREITQRLPLPLKRKLGDDDDDERQAKIPKNHVVLVPRPEIKRVYGRAQPRNIPNALVVADAYHGVPITWLTNCALDLLNSATVGSIIPSKKTTDCTKEVGSVLAWDVAGVLSSSKDKDVIATHMNQRVASNCAIYDEAALNDIRLKEARDLREGAGWKVHGTWAKDHHSFFAAQENCIKYYNAWKQLEVNLRNERARTMIEFDLDYYVSAYKDCVMEWRLKKHVEDLQLTAQRPHHSFQSFQSFQGQSSNSGEGSSQRPGQARCDSTRSICILCAWRGHSVQGHDLATCPRSFKDGSPFWAKKKAADSRTLWNNAGDKEVCINWNYGAKKPCTHKSGEHLHVCSYCGKDIHSAVGRGTCQAVA